MKLTDRLILKLFQNKMFFRLLTDFVWLNFMQTDATKQVDKWGLCYPVYCKDTGGIYWGHELDDNFEPNPLLKSLKLDKGKKEYLKRLEKSNRKYLKKLDKKEQEYFSILDGKKSKSK